MRLEDVALVGTVLAIPLGAAAASALLGKNSLMPARVRSREITIKSVKSPEITITVLPARTIELTIRVDKTEGRVGDTFTFEGQLYYDEWEPEAIPGIEVRLYRNGIRVGASITDGSGRWAITWNADVTGTWRFHAEAIVNGELVKSSYITVTIGEVTLTISVDKTEGRVGDTFTFTGNLSWDGEPIGFIPITLYVNGVAVGTGETDAYGNYRIAWTPTEAGTYTCYTEAEV